MKKQSAVPDYKGFSATDIWMSGFNSRKEPFSTNPVANILKQTPYHQQLQRYPLIELGPGESDDFRDYCISRGLKDYTGVDIRRRVSEPRDHHGATIRYIRMDWLEFLRLQEPNSALIAGLLVFCDELINEPFCHKQGLSPTEIIRALVEEVDRVMVPGGILVSQAMSWPKGLFYYAFRERFTSVFRSEVMLKPPKPWQAIACPSPSPSP